MGKFSYNTYRCIRWCVKTVYPKITVKGLENLPQEPVLLVGNHCKMNGPIAAELYAPGEHDTWCAGEMMNLKEVPAYAYQDFWSDKPKGTRWFYKGLSYLIAPLSVCVFNNANTIGVYHDGRVLSTYKTTVKRLEQGRNVVVFPEQNVPHNHIVWEFQTGFVDVAKLYYKRTGKCLAFVPVYLAPELKTMYLGKPEYYDPANPAGEERHRICNYLMDTITQMAQSLPRHRVVPYPNMPKRQYPYNIPQEASHEKARG